MSETYCSQSMATHKPVDDQQKDEQSVDNICGSSSTTIDVLGEYELIKIFGYFPLKQRLVFNKVCRQWSYCVQKTFNTELVLSRETVDPGYDHWLNQKLFCYLIQKCHNVRHISLDGLTMFGTDRVTTEYVDQLIATIVDNCSHLESIDFGIIQVNEPFKRNANYFMKLKRISSILLDREAINCIIGSQELETLSFNCRIKGPDFERLGSNIRELHLIGTQIDKSGIKSICDGNGKQIQVLTVDIRNGQSLDLISENMKQLKELELRFLSENCDFKRFANFIHLKSLYIESKEVYFSGQDFTDLMRALKFSQILELEIILENNSVTDDSLHGLTKNCPLLQKLVIRGAHSLSGMGMHSIAELTHLKHLDLKKCRNITDEIRIVIALCPYLREVIVHGCFFISILTVELFIEKVNAFPFPSQQFYLDVIGTKVSDESIPMNEEIIDKLPNNLKLLYKNDECYLANCLHELPSDEEYTDSSEDSDD